MTYHTKQWHLVNNDIIYDVIRLWRPSPCTAARANFGIACAKQGLEFLWHTDSAAYTPKKHSNTSIALECTRFSRIQENSLQQLPTFSDSNGQCLCFPKNTGCVAYLWDGARSKWPEDYFMPHSFGNYLCSRWLQLLCTRCCPHRQGPQINGKLAVEAKKALLQPPAKQSQTKNKMQPSNRSNEDMKPWGKKHQRLPARFHALSIHANLQWENIWDHKLGSQCRLPIG